jgi:hypothetical protein
MVSIKESGNAQGVVRSFDATFPQPSRVVIFDNAVLHRNFLICDQREMISASKPLAIAITFFSFLMFALTASSLSFVIQDFVAIGILALTFFVYSTFA